MPRTATSTVKISAFVYRGRYPVWWCDRGRLAADPRKATCPATTCARPNVPNARVNALASGHRAPFAFRAPRAAWYSSTLTSAPRRSRNRSIRSPKRASRSNADCGAANECETSRVKSARDWSGNVSTSAANARAVSLADPTSGDAPPPPAATNTLLTASAPTANESPLRAPTVTRSRRRGRSGFPGRSFGMALMVSTLR
jgi:hypothetical protein